MSNLNIVTGFEKWTILVDVALFNHLGHGNGKHRLLHHDRHGQISCRSGHFL